MARSKTKTETDRIKDIDYEMKGFTLVEILVGLFILSVAIAGIYAVLNIGNMTYYIDMDFLDLQQNARRAMDLMVKELRESSPGDIQITAGGGHITFDTLNELGIEYYFNTQDSQIIREYPPGATRILANNIETLNFNLSGNLLDIQVTARRAQRRDISFLLREQVRLRNE